MFEYSSADIQEQIDALPVALQYWLQWMGIVIIYAPILFIRHRQGRVAILCSVTFMAVQYPLMYTVGLTNLLSLTHLVFWTPLAAYFCYQLRNGGIKKASLFGVWSHVMIATVIISLVFDVRDFGRWLLGDRGIVAPPADASVTVPWLCVVAIIVALAAATAYGYKWRYPYYSEIQG